MESYFSLVDISCLGFWEERMPFHLRGLIGWHRAVEGSSECSSHTDTFNKQADEMAEKGPKKAGTLRFAHPTCLRPAP
jgi:hypothetical protein